MSDGNTTAEALAYMRPAADVYRVDLEGFTGPQYWVEVVTLAA